MGASRHAGKSCGAAQRGHVIVEPEEGFLACGTTGPGRLAEPERIADAVAGLETSRRAIWKAKPCSSPPGPRRSRSIRCAIISNRSSGKMGYALAEAAAAARRASDPGFRTRQFAAPRGVQVVHVRTALRNARRSARASCGSRHHREIRGRRRYHLSQVPRNKIKKTAMRMSLDLDPTPDILGRVGPAKKATAC